LEVGGSPSSSSSSLLHLPLKIDTLLELLMTTLVSAFITAYVKIIHEKLKVDIFGL
jgi:hypothetical protein